MRWLYVNDQSGVEALTSLFSGVMRRKGRGWSVVRGRNDLSVRPSDREMGRFSIVWSRDEFRISFFNQHAGHWVNSTYIRPGPDATEELMTWAEAEVARLAA